MSKPEINSLPAHEVMAVIVIYPDSADEYSVLLYRNEIEEFEQNNNVRIQRILDGITGREIWPCRDS